MVRLVDSPSAFDTDQERHLPATPDEILDAALQLPESDRLSIASRLLDTLPDHPPGLSDDDPQFAAELDRRSGDLTGAIPWEQLRDELRSCPNSLPSRAEQHRPGGAVLIAASVAANK